MDGFSGSPPGFQGFRRATRQLTKTPSNRPSPEYGYSFITRRQGLTARPPDWHCLLPLSSLYSTSLMEGISASPPGTKGSRQGTRQLTDTPLQPTKSRVRRQLHHPAAGAFALATRLALPPSPVHLCTAQVLWKASQHHHPASKAPAWPPSSLPRPPPTDQVQSTAAASSPGAQASRPGHQTGTASILCTVLYSPSTALVLWTASRHHHPASKASAQPPDSLPIPPSNRLPPGLGTTEPCSERPGSRPAEHPTPVSRTLKIFLQVPKEGASPI